MTSSRFATTSFVSRTSSARSGAALFRALSLTLSLSSGALALSPPTVVVSRPEEPLYREPTGSSARRGAASRGAVLPVFGARRGPGCQGEFLMVGPLAWICSEGVETSARPPPSTRAPEELVPERLNAYLTDKVEQLSRIGEGIARDFLAPADPPLHRSAARSQDSQDQ